MSLHFLSHLIFLPEKLMKRQKFLIKFLSVLKNCQNQRIITAVLDKSVVFPAYVVLCPENFRKKPEDFRKFLGKTYK